MAVEFFMDISIIIILAMVIAGIMRLLKQPLIIGYIITGILVSPYFLNMVGPQETMQLLSDIGIAFLLFIVGLSLNLDMLKDVGKISVITGVGQVLFTSFFGFIIAMLLGFNIISSLYIAVALTFSSTIIIMKLLSDKGDLDTLYGRISIGFLLVQDLIVVFALIIISSIAKGGGELGFVLFKSLMTIIAIICLVLLFSYYVLKKIINYVANSQEYLLLFSIAWCFMLASLFAFMDFSIEIGALLAGITLAGTNYKFEIASKMKPLRDFFLILFFIILGSHMVFADVSAYIVPITIFSLFILVGNPLIVIVLMGSLGYTRRNGFLAGLTVAQISEFSLILVAMGVSVGHLDKQILSIVTVIGLITITGSSYMIIYANKIYPLFSGFLKIFERSGVKVDDQKNFKNNSFDVILFGYNRIGFDIFNSFKKIQKKCLVVDYNPDTITELSKAGIDCVYGDAGDIEFLDELLLSKARMVISTIPDSDTNMLLIEKVRLKYADDVIIIVVSHQIDSALELYKVGASYVILPHFLGGSYVSSMIEDYQMNVDSFLNEKLKHIVYLKTKKNKRHEHPLHEK